MPLQRRHVILQVLKFFGIMDTSPVQALFSLLDLDLLVLYLSLGFE
jgi:hypothetical protein